MFVTTSYQLWQLIGREMRERGFFKRTGLPDADWLSDTAGEGERESSWNALSCLPSCRVPFCQEWQNMHTLLHCNADNCSRTRKVGFKVIRIELSGFFVLSLPPMCRCCNHSQSVIGIEVKTWEASFFKRLLKHFWFTISLSICNGI